MKINLFSLLFLLIIATACNKQKSVVKKLTGDWTIYSYTFQNTYGLSYKYETNGIFHFGNCSDEFCDYELNMTYLIAGQSHTKNDLGQYKVEKDGEHFIIKRINTDGSISTFSKNRILLINKNQIKMLIQDESGIHHFVLEK